ncbi:MAG TPA: hypothetical protein VHE61_20885 [Opitutaceae bacterium]|nr:hypothetical protein [Opitutaceae bacterium]
MNLEKLRQVLRGPAGDSDSGAGATGMGGTMAQAKETVTQTAREAAQRMKSAASDAADRAKSEAQRLATEKKAEAASRIGGYGSAMHESARSLEEQDPNIAWATHRIADRIDRVSDYIRNSDFDQLRADAEGFARRHPMAFFGGLFVAGLVVGNLMKAHRPAEPDYGGEDPGNASGSSEPAGDPTGAAGI